MSDKGYNAVHFHKGVPTSVFATGGFNYGNKTSSANPTDVTTKVKMENYSAVTSAIHAFTVSTGSL